MQRTTSKNISDVFGKPHRDVTKAIKDLDCSEEFRARNFSQSSYLSKQNKTLKCVEMTKDGFTFLCMGFTGKKSAEFKEAYIAEFNRMSNALNSISARVNNLERRGLEIKESGSAWSRIGNEIKQAKKQHKVESEKLMSEVQFRLEV